MPAINLTMVRADMLNDAIASTTEAAAVAATETILNAMKDVASSLTTLAVTDTTTPTSTVASTTPSPSATLNVTATTFNPTEQTFINFSTYTTLQGFFLGTTLLFTFVAFRMYARKRTWLTFSNVVQLSLWLTRNFSIIVFNVAPGYLVNCAWRQYFLGIISSSIIVCVWWLQFIKFQSMYQDRPWLVKVMFAVCSLCLSSTFPWIKTTVKLDTLDHCSVSYNSTFQAWYISSDVFVNVLLSGFFSAGIYKHISQTDKSWTSYSRLSYIMTCDVRASFIDTLAQLIKLSINLSPLPSSQTVFGSHVCDWVKVVTAHWFVVDVVQNSEDAGSSVSTGKQCPTCSNQKSTANGSIMSGSTNNSAAPGATGAVLVSIRRKPSTTPQPKVLGTASLRGSNEMLKDEDTAKSNTKNGAVVRSNDTLKDKDVVEEE